MDYTDICNRPRKKKGGAILSPMCELHEMRYSQHDYSTDVWSPNRILFHEKE